MCRKHEETVFHALFSCKSAKTVWRSSNLWPLPLGYSAADFGLLLDFYDVLDLSSLGSFIAAAWVIWFACNQWVHVNRLIPASGTLKRAARILEAYKDHHQPVQPHLNSLKPPISWSLPVENVLKLNVDATILKSGLYGIGFIIRDAMDFPVTIGKRWIKGNISIMEVEAKSCL